MSNIIPPPKEPSTIPPSITSYRLLNEFLPPSGSRRLPFRSARFFELHSPATRKAEFTRLSSPSALALKLPPLPGFLASSRRQPASASNNPLPRRVSPSFFSSPVFGPLKTPRLFYRYHLSSSFNSGRTPPPPYWLRQQLTSQPPAGLSKILWKVPCYANRLIFLSLVPYKNCPRM